MRGLNFQAIQEALAVEQLQKRRDSCDPNHDKLAVEGMLVDVKSSITTGMSFHLRYLLLFTKVSLASG